jgi:hypothetical protein
MTFARRFGPVPFALAVLCSALLSCYKPNVLDGGFKCRPKPAKECPDGFVCDGDSVCRRMGMFDGSVERPETNPDVPPDVPPEVPQICFEPKTGSNCDQADGGGSCDPFCQTGCPAPGPNCHKKCSVNTVGALTCNEVSPGTLRNEFQTCTLNSVGTAAQNDACAPGLVCLEDACMGIGSGSGRCYKFCRSDDDCPNSQCYRTLPGGWRVCDAPNVDSCVPTAPGTSGCTGAQVACYIAIARPSHTVCDCFGDKIANEPCEGSRSCFPGLLCVDPNGGGPVCLRVCDLSLGGADCGVPGAVCREYFGNTGGAMKHPKYGFCF